MELCRHIEKDNGGNIIWVKEGCTLDKTFQYTVKAGTFVSADKCKECSEKEQEEAERRQHGCKNGKADA